MKISPSIASADVMNVQTEVDYIDKYYDNLHIDIEDGVAVQGISFGMKMAGLICKHSTSKEKTLHLEVLDPLNYLEDAKQLNCDVTFIQVSHLKNALEIIKKFKEAGITTGVNLCNDDLTRSDLQELLDETDYVLVGTTAHHDPLQLYLPEMEDFALKVAENKKVWIDGCVTYETYQRLNNSKIYCAVMGRAVFSDKELAVKLYC